MATTQQDAPLSRLPLLGGYVIAFEAISPTTGAAVGGVKVQNVAILPGGGAAAGGGASFIGPFALVPGPGT